MKTTLFNTCLFNSVPLETFLQTFMFFLLKITGAIIIFIIGAFIIKRIRNLTKKLLTKSNADVGVLQFIDSFIKIGLYFLLIAIILINFGVAASSIAALIGTAGITTGLALQGSLSNLAGGVLILLLKPFKVGDFITEDGKGNSGTVSEIHLLYTKLLTIEEVSIIVPNGPLANTSLKNFSTQDIRRLDLSVGVAYNSDITKVKSTIKSVIDKQDNILADKGIDVFVKDLQDYSISIGFRVYVNSADYWAVRASLLENILAEFKSNNIEIPFPHFDINQIH